MIMSLPCAVPLVSDLPLQAPEFQDAPQALLLWGFLRPPSVSSS